MNRIATPHRRRSASFQLVARLDPADERQRFLYAAMQRMHSGRWPLFSSLGMLQIGACIYEAAEWLRARGGRRRYSLVRWDLAACSFSWQDVPTRAAALSALRAHRPSP